jgi:VCBS repeat protein
MFVRGGLTTTARLALCALAGAALAAAPAVGEGSPAAPVGVAFAPYETHALGSAGTAVAIADVTWDGRNDVIITAGHVDDAHWLVVFAQRADGWLAAPIRLATDGASRDAMGVAAGDLNGDGHADVALGTSAGVDVYLQGTDGLQARTLLPTAAPAHHVLIADVTGDGRNDIVASSATQITLLRNTGAGFAVSTLGLTTYESAIAAGDLNGDGRLAVAQLPGTGSGTVAVFSPQPDGLGGESWWSRDVPTGAQMSWNGLDVSDVTGDGRADLIVAESRNRPDSSILIVPQDAPGHFGTPIALPSYDVPQTLRAADVDGDGLNDVVVVHDGWNATGLYLQRSDGTMAPEQLFPLPTNNVHESQGLALGDLNGDGRTDIAIADGNWGLIVLRQTDAPVPSPPPPAPPDPSSPPAAPDTGSQPAPVISAPPAAAPDPTAGATPTGPVTPAAKPIEHQATLLPFASVPATPIEHQAIPLPLASVPRPIAKAAPPVASSRPIVVRMAELRRTGAGLRLRVGWSGGAGRISWSLRLSGRDRRGRPMTRTVSGVAPVEARTVRRLIRLSLSSGAPLRAALTVRNDRRTFTRVLSFHP